MRSPWPSLRDDTPRHLRVEATPRADADPWHAIQELLARRPMRTRSTPPDLITSTEPFLHCCETWHVHAQAGTMIANRPKEPETWEAIRQMQSQLLAPLEERYGVVTLTYGFAGPEQLKAVKLRAQKGGWLPNISPIGDQHAGHERSLQGKRICKRDGIAVDLRVPGHSSEDVANWVIENLPFDRIYLYDGDKPFHLSWSPKPVGQVIRMKQAKSGFLYPTVVRKGRSVGRSAKG